MASDSRADDFTKRYTGLKSKRAVLETHWQEVTDYMAPWENRFYSLAMTPGQKRGQFLLDGQWQCWRQLIWVRAYGACYQLCPAMVYAKVND